MTCYQLEQLWLYEGWCAFCHNEYTKNLLCALEEKTRRIYGPSATIPNRILGAFSLDIRKSSCLLHVKQNTCQNIYLTISLNDVDGIIIGGGVVARPLQFQLGKFITMNGIIEKQDPGWDDIDDKTFFHRSEGYKREDIVMSTTKEYEECFIMYSTMNFIKKLSTKKINKTKARLNDHLSAV